MLRWMILPLRRYADFSGRSRRREFFGFFVLNTLVTGVLLGPIWTWLVGNAAALKAAGMSPSLAGTIADPGPMVLGLGLLGGLWAIGTVVPTVALSVRRLHDRGMSGWCYLAFVIFALAVAFSDLPLGGFITAVVYLGVMSLPGTRGANRFGEDPRLVGADLDQAPNGVRFDQPARR